MDQPEIKRNGPLKKKHTQWAFIGLKTKKKVNEKAKFALSSSQAETYINSL